MDTYLPKFKTTEDGIVIIVSSMAGVEARPCPVYCASKFAVVGLGRSLGMKYSYDRTNVRIVTICPGVTITPLANKIPNNVPDYEMKAVEDIVFKEKPQR